MSIQRNGHLILLCMVIFLWISISTAVLTSTIHPLPASTDSLSLSFQGILQTDGQPPSSLSITIKSPIPSHTDISLVLIVIFSPDYQYSRVLQMTQSEDGSHFTTPFTLPLDNFGEELVIPFQLVIYTPILPQGITADVQFIFTQEGVPVHERIATAVVHPHLAKESFFYASCENELCKRSIFTLHVKGLKSDANGIGFVIPNNNLVQLQTPSAHNEHVVCFVNQLQADGQSTRVPYDQTTTTTTTTTTETETATATTASASIATISSAEILTITGFPFYQDAHYTIVCPDLKMLFTRKYDYDKGQFFSFYFASLFAIPNGYDGDIPPTLPLPPQLLISASQYNRYSEHPPLTVQSRVYPISTLTDHLFGVVNISFPQIYDDHDEDNHVGGDHNPHSIHRSQQLRDFHGIVGSLSFSGVLCESFLVHITSFSSDTKQYERIYSDYLLLTELTALSFDKLKHNVDYLQIILQCTNPVQRIDQGRRVHSLTSAFTFPNLLLPMKIHTSHAPVGLQIAESVSLISRKIATPPDANATDKATFRIRVNELKESLDILDVYLIGNHQFAGTTDECRITNVPRNQDPKDYKPDIAIIALLETRSLVTNLPSHHALEDAPFRLDTTVFRVFSHINLDDVESRFWVVCPHLYVVPSLTMHPESDFAASSYLQVEGWRLSKTELSHVMENPTAIITSSLSSPSSQLEPHHTIHVELSDASRYYSMSSIFNVLPPDDKDDSDDIPKKKGSTIRLLLIIIGSLLGAGVIGTVIFFIIQKRKQRINQQRAAAQIRNERRVNFSDHHVIPDTFYNNADGEYVLLL